MESKIYVVKKDDVVLKAFAVKEEAAKFATGVIEESYNLETKNEFETENSEYDEKTEYRVYLCTPGYVYGRYRYEVTKVSIELVTLSRPIDFDMDATLIENDDLVSSPIQDYHPPSSASEESEEPQKPLNVPLDPSNVD